jgi:hypothetical protein
MPKSPIIAGYAKMWPRAIYDISRGRESKFDKELMETKLSHPGVYILYRDDQPYYIGKTKGPLHVRIYHHANHTGDAYYNFWNFFSAFAVPDVNHLSEIEGLLIASIPTANAAQPSIERIGLPKEIASVITELRRKAAGLG